MATENLGKCISLPVVGDYSANQYKFVTINTSGQAALVGSAGGRAVGVLQDDPDAAGRVGNVMVGTGITKVIAGEALAIGYPVASDATGKAVEAATGEAQLGIVLEAASAADEVVSILFQPRADSYA